MNDFLAVSCGGGRNSAMLLGMYEKGIIPNVILFADTKGEKPETYEAIGRLTLWCLDHFGIPVTTVTKQSMYESLEDNCLKKNMLPSAAYGFRSCSDKWKIQPMEKFLNNYLPAKAVWANGRKVVKAIGYDAGETRRGQTITEDVKYRYWFPLKEWGWYLSDCITAFKRHGLPVPPKSACYYCPSSTKSEVKRLSKEHPDLFAKAVAMERNAENLQTVKGLGRHWKWEELVQISDLQMELLPEAPQMTCTCLDAEE